MKNSKVSILLIGLAMILSACQAKSPVLRNKPVIMTPQKQSFNGKISVEFNPEVDILFIVDNSFSMDKHQDNLVENIHHFVNGFGRNQLIDFRVGITSVWDSERFSRPEIAPHKVYKSGELWHLKGPSGDRLTDQPRWVTRDTPEMIETLKKSIQIGALTATRQYGPVNEEMFTPLADALIHPNNKGFFRDNAQLVIIFLTDAEDGSNIAAQEMAEILWAFKGGKKANKVTTYGVMWPIGETCNGWKSDEGPKIPDPATGEMVDSHPDPLKLAQLIHLTKGRRLSLCSDNYGEELAEIGDDIRRKVGRKIIHLNSVPQEGTLKLTYGKDQVIPWDADTGWSYHRDELATLVISENVDLNFIEGATITAEYIPVNMNHTKNGLTTPAQ